MREGQLHCAQLGQMPQVHFCLTPSPEKSCRPSNMLCFQQLLSVHGTNPLQWRRGLPAADTTCVVPDAALAPQELPLTRQKMAKSRILFNSETNWDQFHAFRMTIGPAALQGKW